MRVGIGMDAHRFEPGGRLVLGGVRIPFEMGLAGHSDADVVLHSLMDAVLGAAGLGDIGGMFPDTDPQYEDASSLDLLARVRASLEAEGFGVVNVDVTIACEQPRIAPHGEEMKANISSALGIPASRVSVKGTTTEGMGFTGRGEGIMCVAVALVEGGEVG